jgi:hypothetical protein
MRLAEKEEAPLRMDATPPRPGRRARRRSLAYLVLVAVVIGALAGWVTHRIVRSSGDGSSGSSPVNSSVWQVAVTGTGPGLAWVVDQQATWVEHAVTGTGPALVTLAQLQTGCASIGQPTGTIGLENLPECLGPQVVMIGAP